MPIIEANCVERPVIAGNNSSMIEVAGEAACLVDAESIEEIRKGILKIINDKEYRENLIIRGRENRLRFDAQEIAAQYEVLYNRILGRHNS
jgi:glycosyltransferase involved in cell wall biosynthesis